MTLYQEERKGLDTGKIRGLRRAGSNDPARSPYPTSPSHQKRRPPDVRAVVQRLSRRPPETRLLLQEAPDEALRARGHRSPGGTVEVEARLRQLLNFVLWGACETSSRSSGSGNNDGSRARERAYYRAKREGCLWPPNEPAATSILHEPQDKQNAPDMSVRSFLNVMYLPS